MNMKKRLKSVLEQPVHKYLGISHVESEKGHGTLTFTANKEFILPTGALHGGILYLLCDLCAYIGLLSIISPEKDAATHDIHISVLRAARAGDAVIIESHVIKIGKNLCFIDVAATVSGEIVATARVTKSLLPVKITKS